MNYAIILAGGSGTRLGADRPKQFIEVLDKPVLAYTLDIFERNSNIDAIEIGCNVNWLEYCKVLVKKYKITKVKWIVNGGETFQETVKNCVDNLKDKINLEDYVMIQYGAAPFTKQIIIDDAIKIAKEKGMSFAATPCYQLMGSKDENNTSLNWVDRDKQIQIACPQTFKFGLLLEIYNKAKENDLLNKVEPHTTSLMYELGYPLYESYSDQTNVKITTKEDLDLFEGWVLMNRKRFKEGKKWL